MNMWRVVVWVLLIVLSGTDAAAEVATECETSQELDKYKWMRRLSLDVRLKPPTWDEYQILEGVDEVPDSLIAEWLSGEGYLESMRRMHSDLLWPNPAGAQLGDVQTNLVGNKPTGIFAVASAQRRKLYRNDTSLVCGDFPHPPEAHDDDGVPLLLPWVDPGSGEEVLVDGWVEVSPYWDPSLVMKVCAFDAQTREISANGEECGEYGSVLQARSCGCGEGLRYCYGNEVQKVLWADMQEQLLRMVDEVASGARPYTDLIVTPDVYRNGRLRFWKSHLAGMASLNKTFNHATPEEGDFGESPDYQDEAWEVVPRSGPLVGIQTLPAFSLRFQTNRARANRFRIAFTSQYFVPSTSPSTDGCDSTSEDLTERCICRDCHKVLEPMAGHFAPIAEAGSVPVVDPAYFPVFNEQCAQKPTGFCNRFYVTDKESPERGVLLTHQFAVDLDKTLCTPSTCDTVHATIATNITEGPLALANTVIASGQFAQSTVRNLFHYLLGRDVVISPGAYDDESSLLTCLSEGFASGKYDEEGCGTEWNAPGEYHFPSLVRKIVQLPQYRRIR